MTPVEIREWVLEFAPSVVLIAALVLIGIATHLYINGDL